MINDERNGSTFSHEHTFFKLVKNICVVLLRDDVSLSMKLSVEKARCECEVESGFMAFVNTKYCISLMKIIFMLWEH